MTNSQITKEEQNPVENPSRRVVTEEKDAGMALPWPDVRSLSWVAPPQDDHAHVPPGSKLRLVASSTWRQGSGHHSKTIVSRQAAARQHSQPSDFGSGGTVGYTKEKKERSSDKRFVGL